LARVLATALGEAKEELSLEMTKNIRELVDKIAVLDENLWAKKQEVAQLNGQIVVLNSLIVRSLLEAQKQS
jgi:hypothetical protein